MARSQFDLERHAPAISWALACAVWMAAEGYTGHAGLRKAALELNIHGRDRRRRSDFVRRVESWLANPAPGDGEYFEQCFYVFLSLSPDEAEAMLDRHPDAWGEAGRVNWSGFVESGIGQVYVSRKVL